MRALHTKKNEGGRKVIHRMRKTAIDEGIEHKVSEGGRKMVHRLIKIRSQSEMGEGGGKMVN